MMSESEIIDTLQRIGFKGAEVRVVMRDVGQVIAMKATMAYLQTWPEAERAKIESLEQEEMQHYLAEHASAFPPFPQAAFDAIHDETWTDYFKSVS